MGRYNAEKAKQRGEPVWDDLSWTAKGLLAHINPDKTVTAKHYVLTTVLAQVLDVEVCSEDQDTTVLVPRGELLGKVVTYAQMHDRPVDHLRAQLGTQGGRL